MMGTVNSISDGWWIRKTFLVSVTAASVGVVVVKWLHLKVKVCYLAPLWLESESLRYWLTFTLRDFAVVGIVLYSRLHGKYWIFLVPLSLPNQFSIVTAVCHDSIVWRHTPRWIDLWASASQFSSSCQEERNRNQSMMEISVSLSHSVSSNSFFHPAGGRAGRMRADFTTQDRKHPTKWS